ncbi:glycosyltransferase [Ideonella sp. DXS29W]|uniref:Glycosyltransferase n=1 Tax=Ideonella lacteola TaxID=2984193 RepID=A0ABU9BXF2_9BURK
MSHAPVPPVQSCAPRRFRVAAVMIVRNEAERIGRALASVLPYVDEVLVLDTGSTDDTVRLAQAAGARVEHFEWVDDFSAARNAALDAAGADWHVVIDADEWLVEGADALDGLRQLAPDVVGAVRIDSVDDHGAAEQQVTSWISRVLPGPVRYAGRVHEQPQHQHPVRRMPISFGHDGYRHEALKTKAGRNRRLLERDVANRPGDAYAWYQLGKDHDVYQRYEEALGCFDRAEALLAAATSEADAPAPAWMHDLTVRSLHALKCTRRHPEALMRAEAGLARWSDSPDFFFALGDLLLDWAADAPDRASELVPMIETAWQRCLAIGERPELEGAVAGRGSHLAASNLALLYDTLGQPDTAAEYRRLTKA